MAAYIRWLAPDMEGMRARIQDEVDRLRPVYQTAHPRTSEIAANLEVGWERFLTFAEESHVITAANRAAIEARVRAALLRGASAQAGHQRDNNPVEKFLNGLQAALAAGAAHVTGPLDKLPEHPGSWGWRRRAVSLVGDGDRWEARGDRIGWLANDTLYILPEPSYKAASAMYADGLGIGEAALRKGLHDAGALLGIDSDGEHLTVKAPRSVDPVQPRVLRLRPDLSAGAPQQTSTGKNGPSLKPADPGSDPGDPDSDGLTGITWTPSVIASPSSKTTKIRPFKATDPGDPGDPGPKTGADSKAPDEGSDEEWWEVGEV
jgi:hypothetical protein